MIDPPMDPPEESGGPSAPPPQPPASLIRSRFGAQLPPTPRVHRPTRVAADPPQLIGGEEQADVEENESDDDRVESTSSSLVVLVPEEEFGGRGADKNGSHAELSPSYSSSSVAKATTTSPHPHHEPNADPPSSLPNHDDNDDDLLLLRRHHDEPSSPKRPSDLDNRVEEETEPSLHNGVRQHDDLDENSSDIITIRDDGLSEAGTITTAASGEPAAAATVAPQSANHKSEILPTDDEDEDDDYFTPPQELSNMGDQAEDLNMVDEGNQSLLDHSSKEAALEAVAAMAAVVTNGSTVVVDDRQGYSHDDEQDKVEEEKKQQEQSPDDYEDAEDDADVDAAARISPEELESAAPAFVDPRLAKKCQSQILEKKEESLPLEQQFEDADDPADFRTSQHAAAVAPGPAQNTLAESLPAEQHGNDQEKEEEVEEEKRLLEHDDAATRYAAGAPEPSSPLVDPLLTEHHGDQEEKQSLDHDDAATDDPAILTSREVAPEPSSPLVNPPLEEQLGTQEAKQSLDHDDAVDDPAKLTSRGIAPDPSPLVDPVLAEHGDQEEKKSLDQYDAADDPAILTSREVAPDLWVSPAEKRFIFEDEKEEEEEKQPLDDDDDDDADDLVARIGPATPPQPWVDPAEPASKAEEEKQEDILSLDFDYGDESQARSFLSYGPYPNPEEHGNMVEKNREEEKQSLEFVADDLPESIGENPAIRLSSTPPAEEGVEVALRDKPQEETRLHRIGTNHPGCTSAAPPSDAEDGPSADEGPEQNGNKHEESKESINGEEGIEVALHHEPANEVQGRQSHPNLPSEEETTRQVKEVQERLRHPDPPSGGGHTVEDPLELEWADPATTAGAPDEGIKVELLHKPENKVEGENGIKIEESKESIDDDGEDDDAFRLSPFPHGATAPLSRSWKENDLEKSPNSRGNNYRTGRDPPSDEDEETGERESSTSGASAEELDEHDSIRSPPARRHEEDEFRGDVLSKQSQGKSSPESMLGTIDDEELTQSTSSFIQVRKVPRDPPDNESLEAAKRQLSVETEESSWQSVASGGPATNSSAALFKESPPFDDRSSGNSQRSRRRSDLPGSSLIEGSPSIRSDLPLQEELEGASNVDRSFESAGESKHPLADPETSSHSLPSSFRGEEQATVDSLQLHHRRMSSGTSSIVTHQEQQDLTQVPTRPGAFNVVKITPAGSVVYEVYVPDGCGPGDEFDAEAGNRVAQVVVPLDYEPGQPLEMELPPDSVTTYEPLRPALLTASPAAEVVWKKRPIRWRSRSDSIGGSIPMFGSVRQMNDAALKSGKSVARTYVVKIPENVGPGKSFSVTEEGFTFQVTCPASAAPGQRIRIVPPPPPPERSKAMQTFRIPVPPGIRPGEQFAATVEAHEKLEVLVECPEGRDDKTTMLVSLPTQTIVGKIQLAYESEMSGWRRTVRATDLNFQWVRVSKKARRDSSRSVLTEPIRSFDFFKSAFVRQVLHLEGNDPRLRTASLRLVPAADAVTESKFRAGGRSLISYSDIAMQQVQPLGEKHEWFIEICRKLTDIYGVKPDPNANYIQEDAYIEIFVRRDNLLVDSMRGVLSLTVAQMRSQWRIRFLGEPALDDGGLTKEWFDLVSAKLFHPDTGFFEGPNLSNQAVVDIHAGSEHACQDAHLMYYRFAGRVIGRALFSNHQIKGHLVRTLYKHLLGWPVTYEDVRDQDETVYMSLRGIARMKDVSSLALSFTATENINGEFTEVDLCENGSSTDITDDNLGDYLEAYLRHRIFGRTLPQLTELLLGFYDVVPEPALAVFDAGELELVLCGLPTIDLADWKAHTEYMGLFELNGAWDPVVGWFWEVVEEDFDAEMRARLLQFATGTSSVPPTGFASLRGHNGKLQKFTIQGVDLKSVVYPKAHTCFNRIDLPMYSSKEELKERLTVSITTSYIGFSEE